MFKSAVPFIFLIAPLFLSGCFFNGNKIEVKNIRRPVSNPVISNVTLSNHQLIIAGSNLDSVNEVKIEGTSLSENFSIETKSASQIVANGVRQISLSAGSVFDLILSSAHGAATFQINFSLCDSTLGSKSIDCTITPNDKEVLSFDAIANKWKPRAVNGLSYQGAWDATGALPPATTAGDYYIVSVANGSYAIGDWIVFNGSSFDQISNSTLITSVFGRTGAVTATEGDYILTRMGDVDLTTTPPVAGKFLKYDGTNWVSGSETDPNVSAFAKSALPTCGAGEVLKGNGTTLSCVTDNAGAGAFTGTANRVVATNASGALAVTSISDTVLGYLSGVTSAVQTQIDSKLDTSTFVDWSAAGVQTLEPSRLNLTTASRAVATNASGVPVATSVTSTELGYLSGVTSAIQTQLSALNIWPKSGSDISYSAGKVSVGSATPYGLFSVSNTTTANSMVVEDEATTDTSAFVIDNSGNVGIGVDHTAAIGYGFRVKKETYFLTNTAGNVTYFYGTGGKIAIGGSSSPGSTLSLGGNMAVGTAYYTTAAPANSLIVQSRIGVALTSPSYPLDVVGDINTSTCFRVGATTVGGTCTSDARLKEEVEDYKYGLQELLGLRPRTYIFNGKGEMPDKNERAVGFIAQEVEEVASDLVGTRSVKLNKDDKFETPVKTVNYTHFTYIIINAIKEFYSEWQSDKEDIHGRLMQLEKENKLLKKYLCKREQDPTICN